MNILYVAIDQPVPGTTGGSVHVTAVAEGLAARGHEVHVAATPGRGPYPPGRVIWHAVRPPLGLRYLRLLRARRVLELARHLRPDVVIERYYNFGGEGVLAARPVGALAVLEVNAPVIDYPGSAKGRLDRLLLVQPMRRWREWQCGAADLVVTPSAAILPPWLPRERIVRIEWGADTERFHPGASGAVPFAREPGDTVAVFSGAFRSWHGAVNLVRAVARLRARGRGDIKAVLIGDGPEFHRVQAEAAGTTGVILTGAVSHDQMPACLAAADIGVAPFDVSAHAPLQLGFYWSPLKIFEYMAAGLPVVAPDIDRLRHLVAHGREALLYDPSDPDGLAHALEELANPERRRFLGTAARERVVRDFTWSAHCRTLDESLAAALERARRDHAVSR